MSYYRGLVLIFIVGKMSLALFMDSNSNSCEQNSTSPGYYILVTHGKPSSHDHGKVLIKSELNRPLVLKDPLCTWTYLVEKVHYMQQGSFCNKVNKSFSFSKPGLQNVSVTFNFKKLTVKNCTLINVTDCTQIPKVKVSTSTGTWNITKNHTDITLNPPVLVNFSVPVVTIDPYFICKPLHFIWELGNGFNVSGQHIEHWYNKTGSFPALLKIYKVHNDDDNGDSGKKELVRNITITLCIKEKQTPTKNMETVIDVSLVLTIFFVCFVFVLCIVAYWFRKRLNRHTEVARFDFRDDELQTSFAEPMLKINCNRNPRILSAMSCRRGSNDGLLNFEEKRHYSSCKRFDNNPDEDL